MSKDEYYDDDEENVHVISDQDSTEDKPQIESIIHETKKKFENESHFIKILLSDHYKDFRKQFFGRIRRTDKSVYQAIKKEIRNSLNPYRIYKEKETEVPNEVQELYELLKGYYKERNFNNTFFLNYFKDLEEAHKKKSKINVMLPKDEIETLNDIQRKVIIIKNLRHYLNTTISDRIQINFEQKKEMFQNDYFLMMYQYLVIDEEEFSKMDGNKLSEYLSNKTISSKLRRPLNDFNVYNYIPILCKGYCKKEAEMFIDKFNKNILNHYDGTKCNRCKEIKEQMSKINNEIRSLYLKTCIFSHNINEIMFHPLMFFSLEVHLPFYQKQFRKKIEGEIADIVQESEIPKRFKNLKGFEIQNIYNPANVGMKKIFNLLAEYAKKRGLYGNCCYLSEYKTEPCKIDFKPSNNDFYEHMKRCPDYHSNLERRRITKNKENEICKNAIKDGKWIDDKESIDCINNDFCSKYHTRNEVFFDEKNYRKLYPCTEPYYCEKGELCPKKHAIDIKIEEIYLPFKNKNDLETVLQKIINKNNELHKKLQIFNKIICKSCLNFIDGAQERNMYYINHCKHIICSNCYKYYNSCPICGFNDNEKNSKNKGNNAILIKIDGNIKIKKKKKRKEESDVDEKEESDADEFSDNDDYQNDDKDLPDINNNYSYDDDKIGSDISDFEANFPKDESKFSINSEDQEKEKDKEKESENNHSRKGVKRGKGIRNNENNESRRNNDKNQDSYNENYSYYRNRGNRGRGRGYRGRGERGRGRGRSGYRGRGSYYSNSNNSYINNNGNFVYEENDENSSYNQYNESSSIRRGKGKKRGSNFGEKSRYDNSRYSGYDNDNENESKDNSRMYKSKIENEEDDDNDNTMIKEHKSRKGVIRGGRGGRGKGVPRGKNIDKKIEELDNSEDSKDGNELSNSMENNTKNNQNSNAQEEESD